MSATLDRAQLLLNERFILEFPREAAKELERLPEDEAAQTLAPMSVPLIGSMAVYLLAESAAGILRALPDERADALLAELPAPYAVRVLAHFEADELAARLQRLDS